MSILQTKYHMAISKYHWHAQPQVDGKPSTILMFLHILHNKMVFKVTTVSLDSRKKPHRKPRYCFTAHDQKCTFCPCLL